MSAPHLYTTDMNADCCDECGASNGYGIHNSGCSESPDRWHGCALPPDERCDKCWYLALFWRWRSFGEPCPECGNTKPIGTFPPREAPVFRQRKVADERLPSEPGWIAIKSASDITRLYRSYPGGEDRRRGPQRVSA